MLHCPRAAARSLAALNAEVEAQKLIESVLDASDDDAWAPKLVGIYGRLTAGDQMARIAKAEAWLRRHQKDASILIDLGRMCFRKRLWGKAQTYLDASLAVEAVSYTHLTLPTSDLG